MGIALGTALGVALRQEPSLDRDRSSLWAWSSV